MSKTVLDMSVSVDGYIAGPNDGPGNPGGDDFRLHDWGVNPETDTFRGTGVAQELLDEIAETGAVVLGRRLAEQVDHWGGDHHGRGVPVIVLSHRPPAPHVAGYPLVRYVSDIATAIKLARDAAGDRDILVHGGITGSSALKAGLIDEIHIHQVPVLYGAGVRFFDVLPERIQLDILKVIDTPEATHIRYGVRR